MIQFPRFPLSCQLDSLEMTPEQLEQAREYNRAQLKFTLWDKALDFVYMGTAAFVLAKPLGDYLAQQPWAHGQITQLAIIILTFFVLHIIVSAPISFYSGFALEHKYGLSNQTVGAWVVKQIKQYLLVGLVELAYMTGLFMLIFYAGIWWIPLAVAIFFLLSVVLGMLLPVLILPLFYKIEKLENETLLAGLQRLTEGTSLTLEGVYKMNLSSETVKANAMLAGFGATRRVILGDTLLDSFAQDEIETVFAHEIGHHVHSHLWKMIPISLLFSAVSFAICDGMIRLLTGAEGFSYSSVQPWIIIPIQFFLLTVVTFYEPLSNAISRRFERQADAYALAHCGADAYIRAFTRLGKLNKADPNPPKWEVIWFESHPPIGERIAMAKK